MHVGRSKSAHLGSATDSAVARDAGLSRALFEGMFFDVRRYDFSRVGRLKFNTKLGTEVSLDDRVLSPDDFFRVTFYLLGLRKGFGQRFGMGEGQRKGRKTGSNGHAYDRNVNTC